VNIIAHRALLIILSCFIHQGFFNQYFVKLIGLLRVPTNESHRENASDGNAYSKKACASQPRTINSGLAMYNIFLPNVCLRLFQFIHTRAELLVWNLVIVAYYTRARLWFKILFFFNIFNMFLILY
jgi:hypothetical protein